MLEGATTREVFEIYIERVLAPTLRVGQVVVMDNLSAHKGERVRELIEARGCELLYLPPYSPDLNPIEEAFAKVKALLQRAEARTCETLVEALGRALEGVTVRDVAASSSTVSTALLGQPLEAVRRHLGRNVLDVATIRYSAPGGRTRTRCGAQGREVGS